MNLDRDREVVRRLAAEVRELAERPEQRRKIELWTALNDLRPERPMLWITEIPWGEFENDTPELKCVCADPEARRLEAGLRRKLFTARHFPCDEVVEPFWRVGMRIEGADFGVRRREQTIAQGGSYIQSHHYEPVIRAIADVEKVQMPSVRYRREETERAAERAADWLGDALPVRVTGPRGFSFSPWDILVEWTGVTEALSALYDDPEFLHALLRRMTDAMLARVDQMERLGLIERSNECARVGSGGAGYTSELPRPGRENGPYAPADVWGFAAAQIFCDVSPAMHEEFALRYEIEFLSRFGLNYYGCCEPLHNKMALMNTIPRLRKISVSPWCDAAKARAGAARRYVFSHKPSPAIFAEDALDLARAEADLRKRLADSGDMPCEIIMKDISTVRGDWRRLAAWCEMAYRLVQS